MTRCSKLLPRPALRPAADLTAKQHERPVHAASTPSAPPASLYVSTSSTCLALSSAALASVHPSKEGGGREACAS